MTTKAKPDFIKYGLIAGMMVVAFMLLQEWSGHQDRQRQATASATDNTTLSADAVTPTLAPEASQSANDDLVPVSESEQPAVKVPASTNLIEVRTDYLDIAIDPRGGDIVRVALPQHHAELGATDKPFILLNRSADNTYIAQSGLVGANGTDKPGQRPLFSSAQSSYVLDKGQETLEVVLSLEQDGALIEKVFTFTRSDYLVDMEYRIQNNASETFNATLYAQITRDSKAPLVDTGIGMQPFLGAALTTKEENYKKLNFDDIAEEGFKATVQGGWVAMVQHYFVSAWIPAQDVENKFNLRKVGSRDLYTMGFTSPNLSVDAGQQGSIKASFYAGPKDIYRMEKIAPYLDLVVDYSWLWWVAKPLFYFLHWLHSILGNWGIAIIVLTISVKAAFFKLSATSYRSMAGMRKLQPEMVRLKELHGNDRQKMSQELMKLYKKEKVNPMSGCLPILVQMPVFLALYWVLMESVELRHTAFLWLDDLSVKDPFFVLPLLMGASMWVQMKLNPTPPDPTQAKVMQMMPIVFTFLFMWFPSGLVLYWVTNNLLSIAQQYVITKKIENS